MTRKLLMGPALRRLREKNHLSQSAFAERLGLSFSYICQLENNQRPVTASVLLKLTQVFQVDLSDFSEDRNRRLLGELDAIFRDQGLVGDASVSPADIDRMVHTVPALAETLVALYQKQLHLQEELQQLVDRFYGDSQQAAQAPFPHEAARDFFNRHDNYFDALDRQAEQLAQDWALQPGRRAAALREQLQQAHGIEVVAGEANTLELRQYDARRRRLVLKPQLGDAQQAFQMATQLCFLAHGDLLDQACADETALADAQTRTLARQGLAHYFAGALLLPYGEFLQAARSTRYDVEQLQRRFQVSFESVCHRLSTLQRSGARGVPMYLIRVDQAGNVSKRQSANSLHFARHGGTCPLWHVFEAFAQPGQILTQVAEMPDGTRYFGIARSVQRGGGSFHAPRKRFAFGIGCELAQARELVYADGWDLQQPRAITPIGPGCRVCPRTDCVQRAFPPAGKPLHNDDFSESLVSYRLEES